MKKYKDANISKYDVINTINCNIREHIVAQNNNDITLALYKLLDEIDSIPTKEATWIRDADGARRCSNYGYRFFNATAYYHNYCCNCGYVMTE